MTGHTTPSAGVSASDIILMQWVLVVVLFAACLVAYLVRQRIRHVLAWARGHWSAIVTWAGARPWHAPFLAILTGGGLASLGVIAYLIAPKATVVTLLGLILSLVRWIEPHLLRVRAPEPLMAHHWRKQWPGR